MSRTKWISLVAVLSILALQACGAGISKADLEETIAGGIARTQTMQSGMEQGVEATLTALAKEAAQAAPAAATVTPTQAAPAQTSTPGNVTVTVSNNTWCSTGPGTVYDHVFILYIGQTARVIGRDANSHYWVIEKPDNHFITCWLWGKYATITGDADSVPVVTPPPTPTLPATSMVTAVTITFAKSVIHGSCTFTNTVTVTITTNSPAMVHYILKNTSMEGNNQALKMI